MEERKYTVKKASWPYRFFKRLFDILISLIALLLFSPILIIVFIIQLFVTKGHPIFADKRVGKNKKIINVLKFRSMVYDAETNIEKYLTPEQIEIWKQERKLDDDPRITRFGNFLRKSSIDELPQLFNILFGSMSLVGYRPMTERELNLGFNEEERNILASARPGLTGYWQVYGRSDVDFKSGKRQSLELEYFSKRGFFMDTKILFLTVPAVLKGKGAR